MSYNRDPVKSGYRMLAGKRNTCAVIKAVICTAADQGGWHAGSASFPLMFTNGRPLGSTEGQFIIISTII